MPAVLFNRPDQIQPKSERNFVQFILSSLLTCKRINSYRGQFRCRPQEMATTEAPHHFPLSLQARYPLSLFAYSGKITEFEFR